MASITDLTPVLVFFLTLFVGVLAWMGRREVNRVDKLSDTSANHEKRIQSMEDLHGVKLDTLEKKIDKLEISIQTLANNLHKEKNMEGALAATLTALVKTLDKMQDKLE